MRSWLCCKYLRTSFAVLGSAIFQNPWDGWLAVCVGPDVCVSADRGLVGKVEQCRTLVEAQEEGEWGEEEEEEEEIKTADSTTALTPEAGTKLTRPALRAAWDVHRCSSSDDMGDARAF